MPKIEVKGAIVSDEDKWIYDWYGVQSTSPKDISKGLATANGQDVEVDINSGGGDIFAGSEIYTALRSYKGNVQINIVGLAASAASVIAMAGKSKITPTGMFMIHNVSSYAEGDYRDMAHNAEILKVANQSIANAYKDKTGLSDKALLALMDKETWMSAEDTVKNKFVDGVMFANGFTNQSKLAFYNSTTVLPPEAIEKIRNTIKNPQSENLDDTVFLMEKAKAQLNLLKLKGETRHEI